MGACCGKTEESATWIDEPAVRYSPPVQQPRRPFQTATSRLIPIDPNGKSDRAQLLHPHELITL